MRVTISIQGNAKEIAALVVAIQERQGPMYSVELCGKLSPEKKTELADTIRSALSDMSSAQGQSPQPEPKEHRPNQGEAPHIETTGDILWRHLADVLGDGEAKNICEDIAIVLANHHLVQSPDLCKALFYHMISVTEDWNSVKRGHL